MQFQELDTILKRLNADYGVTSITMSEDGFAELTEQVKPYLFKAGAQLGKTEFPNIQVMPRIGNVLIEVKPEHKKPVFLDPDDMAAGRACKLCKHSSYGCMRFTSSMCGRCFGYSHWERK